ncbi:hypothetical protein [Aquamicrobium defluvii]|uniref:Uncharacterized protein n=1 Tax=Aquamicrobium defluvii TaxID=69279 RepID=A0A4R6YKC6_9HYPH|nr:hypothetical protein [Aquamicrobium defluvii]TDR37550.1 hypothetical protein DES43_10296 [Aquamicrobium defluvii]
MRGRALIALPLLTLPLLTLMAALASAADDAERYRLEKTEDGYVRMDTATGAMSACREQSGRLVCRMAADERTVVQDEMDRLQDQVRSLEERVARLENSLTAKLESSLPTEEEFNRTMGYMERFFRSFMGIVKDLEKQDSPEAKPAPDRT